MSFGPEASIQIAVVQFATLQCPSAFILSVPNEGKRSLHLGAHMKRMGLTPGAPDLLLFNSRATPPCMAWEVKSPKGCLTDNQKRWRDQWQGNGFTYDVIRSVEDASESLKRAGWVSA